MSAPRPKPWEVSSGTSAAAQQEPQVLSPEPVQSVPDRPTSLPLSSSYGHDPYAGSSMVGGLGNSMGYGSYGGMGGGGYGGYSGMGGYGGGMGGYAGGMGGYGRMGMGGYGGGSMYGMGGYGMNGVNGNPMNGDGGFAESTQATFQLIESVIGAFGGFAQMLEATYMATHSSFFTMISVAEQFGNLRNALGSFLGIFALIKYFKKLVGKVTGSAPETLKIDAREFAKFEARKDRSKHKSSRRISLKPLLIFLAMVIGTPYLLKKLVFHLAKQRNLPLPGQQHEPVDLANVDFGRALYDFIPENPQVELALKEGDLVAILSKSDPQGKPSQWWRVRSRSGKTGYIPGNYVELIKKVVAITENNV